MSATTTTAPNPPPDRLFGGASNGKVGMWVFLFTDVMTFSAGLLAYAALRAADPHWPNPSERLGIALTAVMTFILICSSVTMVFAVDAMRANATSRAIKWLLATVGGGLFFLSCQALEWSHFFKEGSTISTDQFWTVFFSLTGFHGAHVFSGVLYLSIVAFLVSRKKADANIVEIAGLFWHFVDLVWILIFTFIYLI